MKKIKRIIFLIPLSIILCLSFVPLSAFANTDTADDYPSSMLSWFLTPEECFGDDIPDDYLLIRYASENFISDNNSSYTHFHYLFTLILDLSEFDYEVSSDDVYTFSLPVSPSCSYYIGSSSFLESKEGSNDGSRRYTFNSYDYRSNSIIYDSHLNKVYFNDTEASDLFDRVVHVHSVDFVLDSHSVGKSSIKVECFPKLEGKSTLNMYQMDVNGFYDDSKPTTPFSSTQLIDVDIINNTNDDYQFALYFVEKGGKLRFYESMSDFTVGAKFFSNNPQFIYITDEWYYYSTESFSHSFVRGPSAWHIVSSGSTVTCHVGENQLQLKKGIEYDIVVIGCPVTPHNNTYFSPVDERYLISGIDPYINLNSNESLRPKELYRSTFYLDRDTAYKNTTMSNDENLSFSGGISYGFDPYGNNDDTFNTYYMKDDSAGSDHITEVLPQYGLHSFNSNLGSNDSWFKNNSSSSSSYSSSFIYRYSDFFGLVRSFLSSLPAEFMNIYIYGFTAVVVVGVVKAVK